MMPMSMSTLLEELSRDHFPRPPATPEEIGDFERRMGWRLDPDLRAFYLHCNGAELFKPLPETHYRILSLSEIVRARVAIFSEDSDEDGPASQYAICDVQTGDYVVVDVSRQHDNRYPLMDADHENWPDPTYCEQIANSFSEFLEKALRSKGRLYYLRTSQDT
jgi:hypothetical protein